MAVAVARVGDAAAESTGEATGQGAGLGMDRGRERKGQGQVQGQGQGQAQAAGQGRTVEAAWGGVSWAVGETQWAGRSSRSRTPFMKCPLFQLCTRASLKQGPELFSECVRRLAEQGRKHTVSVSARSQVCDQTARA